MSETTSLTGVREAIADARQTVARDTVLNASFKAKAIEGLDLILADVNSERITLEKANALGASLMQAVLIQREHDGFQSRQRVDAAVRVGPATAIGA